MPAIALAILAGLCWGIGELFTKSVLHTGRVGPMTAIAVRSAVALPFLLLAWALAVRGAAGLPVEPQLVDAGRANLFKLTLGSGLVAGGAAMIFFYAALSVGEISRVKPVAFGVAPATAVLLGWLVLGERMTMTKALGTVLILAGVLLLTRGAGTAATR
ncbi:MAG: EamA family transporter [Phycisphaerales bacterium]|nr:EamA family transporter [Phycisphaerales bacterium]